MWDVISLRLSSLPYRNSLLNHQLTVHSAEVKVFLCHFAGCDFVADKPYSLKTHMWTHTEERNFSCTVDGCEYRGKTKAALWKWDLFLFNCNFCFYKFELLSHCKVHQHMEKHLECDICDYKTTSSSHLKRHKKSHTKEKNLQCPYCSYKCSDMEYLRKHILQTKAHPGKFLYNCEKCKEFKTNFFKEFNHHVSRCDGVE